MTTSYTKTQQREETILSFLPLVKHIAGRISINASCFLETEDLVESGIIGLISAVDSYDPSFKTSLKTHVFTRIRGAILDELRKASFLSRGFQDKLSRFCKGYEKLEKSLNRPPSLNELSESLNLDHEQLNEILTAWKGMSFLSIENDQNQQQNSLLNLLSCPKICGPEESAMGKELKKQLGAAISELPEREQQVIVLYYYKGLLLKEISKILSISSARVSHLHSRALYRLNSSLASKGLSENQKISS